METLKHVDREQRPSEASAIAGPAEPLGNTVEESDPGDSRSTIQRMCFAVGDLGLLFPFSAGREVIGPPAVSRVPNTVSWLRGLANVRGALIPIVDAAAAFGVASKAGVPPYVLIFGHGETAVGLLIDGLPRSLEVDASAVATDTPAPPQLLRDSVIASYDHAGRTWLDIDIDALFDALVEHVASAAGDDMSGDARSEMN